MTASHALAATTNSEKEFRTQQARAACVGVLLHQLEGDFGTPIYIATRWALTKQFDHLSEVGVWLDRVIGGTHA